MIRSRRGVHGLRWLVLLAAVIAAGELTGRLGLPTPYLFASFVVAVAYALCSGVALVVPNAASAAAQGVIGLAAGSYIDRATMSAVGAHAVAILGFCVLTIVLSVLSGIVLARLVDVDRPTAAFGMIAGGAAGIISISRELGADERLVAVLQYLRVLMIVALTPIVAVAVFGAQRMSTGASAPAWTVHGVVFLAVALALGISLARLVHIPAGAILGPMLVAAGLSLLDRGVVAPPPPAVIDAAFVCIGLDVGLRFTKRVLREAGRILVYGACVILAMILASAGLGAILAELTGNSLLDGYLATTPGGLSAVLALAIGSRTNTTFIVSVQVIRTFLMLLLAPPLARWLALRGPAPAPEAVAD